MRALRIDFDSWSALRLWERGGNFNACLVNISDPKSLIGLLDCPSFYDGGHHRANLRAKLFSQQPLSQIFLISSFPFADLEAQEIAFEELSIGHPDPWLLVQQPTVTSGICDITFEREGTKCFGVSFRSTVIDRRCWLKCNGTHWSESERRNSGMSLNPFK